MRLLRRSLSAAAAAVLCAACGSTPGLELTVTPGSVPGDGASPITVLAKLTQSGTPVAGSVHLKTTFGRFKDAVSGDPTVFDSTDGNAVIIAPRRGRGTLEVTATASLDGTALTKTVSVALTPSGGLASSLTFSCAKQNIGAFVTGRTDPIHVLCIAQAFDAAHVRIPNASIETMAEAGSLDWQTDPASGVQYLVYSVAVGAAPPKDVEPFDASGKPVTCPSACIADPSSNGCIEPCWIDSGQTHNPRDGLATLVVAVPGVNSFDDKGEPFVDADDSGSRESGEDYIDYNGNGKYDPPDGTQKSRMIWQALRIVWSGDADTTATPHGSKIVSVVSGKTATVTLRLNDRNFNTLAADGTAGADVTTFTVGACTNSGTLTLPATIPLNQDKPGIKLNATTGDIDGPQFSSTYRNGSDYAFTASIDATGNMCPISAAVSRAYDPGAPPLFTAGGSSSGEAVSGSLNFP